MSEKKAGVRQATESEAGLMHIAESLVFDELSRVMRDRMRFDDPWRDAYVLGEASGRVSKAAMERNVTAYRTACMDVIVCSVRLLVRVGDETQETASHRIAEERLRQNDKFGVNVVPPLVMACVLSEEVGEAFECMTYDSDASEGWESLRAELTQCAAVGVKAYVLANVFPELFDPPRESPTTAELARVAYEAYSASTGNKTHNGLEMPAFDDVVKNKPHVMVAWASAARAVRAL